MTVQERLTQLKPQQLDTLMRVLERLKDTNPTGGRVDLDALIDAVDEIPERELLRRVDPHREDRIGARAYELTIFDFIPHAEAIRQATAEIDALDFRTSKPRLRVFSRNRGRREA